MNAVLRAGDFVLRLFCLSNHRWLSAAFVAIAVMVGAHTASAADLLEIHLLHAARVGADVDLVATGPNDPKAHFSWKLEQTPKGSKAKISDHNSAQTSFRPDVAGLYVVQVTVKVRNLSLTATVPISPSCATEPLTAPLNPVNTILNVKTGQQGMTVGTCSWSPQSTQSPSQFQVLYLNRNSKNNGNPLSAYPVTNSVTNPAITSEYQTYPVTQSGITAMYNNFNALPTDGSVLVFVNLPASAVPSGASRAASSASPALPTRHPCKPPWQRSAVSCRRRTY